MVGFSCVFFRLADGVVWFTVGGTVDARGFWTCAKVTLISSHWTETYGIGIQFDDAGVWLSAVSVGRRTDAASCFCFVCVQRSFSCNTSHADVVASRIEKKVCLHCHGRATLPWMSVKKVATNMFPAFGLHGVVFLALARPASPCFLRRFSFDSRRRRRGSVSTKSDI